MATINGRHLRGTNSRKRLRTPIPALATFPWRPCLIGNTETAETNTTDESLGESYIDTRRRERRRGCWPLIPKLEGKNGVVRVGQREQHVGRNGKGPGACGHGADYAGSGVGVGGAS